MRKKVPVQNRINVFNSQRRYRVPAGTIERFACLAAQAAGLSGRELTVQFVGSRKMAELNSRFRGNDYATDVLSFQGNDRFEAGGYLGDIAICPEIAARHSRYLARELKILVLHGILHLMDYDHEADRGEMNRLELKLRRRLGLR